MSQTSSHKQNFVLYHDFRDNLLCIIIARTDIRISFRGTAILQYSCLENPHGQRSLAGYSPWGCKESDMTEQLNTEDCRKQRLSS